MKRWEVTRGSVDPALREEFTVRYVGSGEGDDYVAILYDEAEALHVVTCHNYDVTPVTFQVKIDEGEGDLYFVGTLDAIAREMADTHCAYLHDDRSCELVGLVDVTEAVKKDLEGRVEAAAVAKAARAKDRRTLQALYDLRGHLQGVMRGVPEGCVAHDACATESAVVTAQIEAFHAVKGRT